MTPGVLQPTQGYDAADPGPGTSPGAGARLGLRWQAVGRAQLEERR